jgi:hypothetical protein
MPDIDFDAGVWAVVRTPGGDKFVGNIEFTRVNEGTTARGVLEHAIRNGIPLRLDPAFELIKSHVPVKLPTGQVALDQLVQLTALDNAIAPSPILTVITSAHLFSEMHELSRERHKGLVNDIMSQLTKLRVRELGLATPEEADAGHRRHRS